MRLLVLGGTAWLGKMIARVGLERGHEVTCLARAETGTAPAGAALVRADRDAPAAYRDVVGEWDVVVDVSRQPGQVRRAVGALADRAASFVFVSSGSVYADHGTPGDDESAALLPALEGEVMETMDAYGPAKVACERHVRAGFGPERALVVRSGLIAGPGDASDRTGYWPVRFARPAADDGAVLVPDVPDLPTQVIDVRDLAGWIVGASERGLAGSFNAVGEPMPLPVHLAAARAAAGHTGPVVPVPPDWLVARDVTAWTGERSLPLWLPLPEYAGFSARDGAAARAAGLIPRPLADTLAWELTRDPTRSRRAGLSREDERDLLDAYAAR
jgi:2'-hydroxyisoflavone reductase